MGLQVTTAEQGKHIESLDGVAYVFDDGRLKLIFNCTKEHREVELSLEEFSRKEGKGEDNAEVSLSSSHLHMTLAGLTISVYMIKGYFVCDVPAAV